MCKISNVFVIIILSTILMGCMPSHPTNDRTLYVSILPLRQIVGDIVGDDFDIEVLVPAGASPETFEPTPKQFIALNNAQMVFNIGLIDFEQTLLSKLTDTTKIVDLSRGITTIAGSCSHHSNGRHHTHGIDPHIWTSPKELQIMAANAYEAIRRNYPDSSKYERNYEALSSKLHSLDSTVHKSIKHSNTKYFIIYHPALTYYAQRYGLEQVAIENEGKEPSAKRLSQIIGQARKDGVRRIFYQQQFPASSVEIIARDLEGEYVMIDPLREDVINNILEITNLIISQ